jgi:hypothetical protein
VLFGKDNFNCKNPKNESSYFSWRKEANKHKHGNMPSVGSQSQYFHAVSFFDINRYDEIQTQRVVYIIQEKAWQYLYCMHVSLLQSKPCNLRRSFFGLCIIYATSTKNQQHNCRHASDPNSIRDIKKNNNKIDAEI